jgi:hypothetical protein
MPCQNLYFDLIHEKFWKDIVREAKSHAKLLQAISGKKMSFPAATKPH